MDVHRADIAAVLIAPDEVKQIFAGVDAVRIADEQLDKVKLACRQLDGLAVLIDVALLRVDSQAACRDAVVLVLQPPLRRSRARMRAFSSRMLNGFVM